jgi:hypothetical protein
MDKIEKQKIALLGGGQRCKAFLQVILSEDFDEKKPEILGVVDINERDMALQYAKDKGIFTTSDVKDLFFDKGPESHTPAEPGRQSQSDGSRYQTALDSACGPP